MAFLHLHRSREHFKNLSKDLNGHMKTPPHQLALWQGFVGFNTNKTMTMYNMATDNVCLSPDTSKEMLIANFWSTKGEVLRFRAYGYSYIIGHTHAPDATNLNDKPHNEHAGCNSALSWIYSRCTSQMNII